MQKKTYPFLIRDIQMFADPDDKPGEDPADPNQEDDPSKKYIEAIANLKKTTVSREDYAKLEKENKELLASLLDGKALEVPPGEASRDEPSLAELRKELFSKDSSMLNLDYVKKALQLRDKIIEEMGEEYDPFAPQYPSFVQVTPDQIRAEREQAKIVADQLRELVDKADGSPAMFNGLLSGAVVDDPMIAAKVAQKKRKR